LDNFEGNGEIFSLRVLLDYCKRRSGRTQHVANVAIEHLEQTRPDILIIVIPSKFSKDFISYLYYLCHEKRIPMKRIQGGLFESNYSTLIVTDIFSENLVIGRRVRDIIFDAPEVSFFNDSKKFETAMSISHCLSNE